MTLRHTARTAGGLAMLAALLAFVVSPPTASAQFPFDRTPPTTPTNLRVTATTPYSISLAWNPSSDNSRRFSYAIQASHGPRLVADHPTTTYKLDFGLSPGQTYSFFVYAFDRAGNRSGNSNTVTATTPLDTTPPTAPVLSLVDVEPTQVALRWTASTDDTREVGYTIFKNGSPAPATDLQPSGSGSASVIVRNLTPSTTYSFTVQASDRSSNTSPHSNAVTVTTESTGGDASPPTAPANLTLGSESQGCEAWLSWSASTDNADPPLAIRYEVYVNGVPAQESSTTGYTRTVAYARLNGTNSFVVRAFDRAGNQSGPSNTVTLADMVVC